MYQNMNFPTLMRQKPQAEAEIRGSADYPDISGKVNFFQTGKGVFVVTQVSGMPTHEEPCRSPVFGYHIHSGKSCTGNKTDPFADALTHYNPKSCAHPHHAGDMPPLFGNNGYAFSVFLTDRFTVEEIIGRTVIIHSMPDDFTTQPAGNSGMKIACGVIRAVR